jgi:hypothetical protein
VDGGSGEAGGEPSKQAARSPGVAADDDLHDLRRVAIETGDLEIIDLAAVLTVTVEELVIEEPEGDVDLGDLAYPRPPFLRSIKGMAATAIARMTTK